MRRETLEKWIIKAESDLKIGRDEMMTENPATDAICFHMQQCTEKYLKVFLIFHDRELKRTHNIAELIDLCAQIDNQFVALYDMGIPELTTYAVDIRYGDDFYVPTVEEAKEAIAMAEETKAFVLKKLGERGFVFSGDSMNGT